MNHSSRILAVLTAFVIGGLSIHVSAQFYVSGNDSWRIHWNYIDAGGFRVIYPEGMDSLAFRYGRLLESATPFSLEGLDVKLRKRQQTPLILHPFSVDMNASVAQAPLRMEFYTIPNSDGYAQDWAATLAMHEGRHVAQVYKSGEHVFRPLRFLIGAQAESVGMAYLQAFNRGLIEGDAVVAETEFSLDGRGRQASFLMPYRAYIMDSVRFSYDKWHFGSYKHSIPNVYALGYMEQSYARWKALNAALSEEMVSSKTLYGGYSNPTAALMDRQLRLKLPLSRVYKQSCGAIVPKNWDAAYTFYSENWQNDNAEREERDGTFDQPRIHSRPEKNYVAYHYPVVDNEGRLYALRSSLSRIPHLCRLHEDGSSEFLCHVGFINSPLTSFGETVYWTEQVRKGRWEQESNSVLYEYNVKTGKRRQLTENSYFFNPSISRDGTYLSLSNNTPDGGSRLVVLRMGLRSRRMDYDLPEGCYAKESVWDADNNLYVVLQNDKGLSLWKYDLLQDDWMVVIEPQHRAIRHLTSYKDYLLFDSDLNGIDNLYALDLKSGQMLRIGNAPVGSFEPCVSEDEDKLYYVSYSTAGYELAEKSLSEALSEGRTVSVSSPEPFLIDRILAGESKIKGAESPVFQSIPDELQAKEYEVSSYSKMSHALKFHSWLPVYYQVDDLAAYSSDLYTGLLAPGLTLYTQNDLSTAYGQLGYSWKDGYHAAHAKFTYKGLPPVFDFTAHYNSGPSYDYETLGRQMDTVSISGRPSLKMAARVYYPHIKYREGWSSAFVPSLTLDFSNDMIDDVFGKINSTPYGLLFTTGGFEHYKANWLLRVQYYRCQNTTKGDIFPRLGIGGQLSWKAPLDLNTLFAHTVLGQIYFYIPGFGSHQAIRLSYTDQALMTADNTRWMVDANMLWPRGISAMAELVKPEMQLFTFDYALPLNLDWSIPYFLYVKRLELVPFAECLHTIDRKNEINPIATYFSAGAEALVDFVPLRLSVSPKLGARVTYSTATHDWQAEMLSSFSF